MAQCELVNKESFEMNITSNLNHHFDSLLPDNFFSYSHTLYFFKKGQPSNVPTGLLNVGYNCYMNTVIQCLAFTPGFKYFCLSIPNAMYEANKEGAFFFDLFAQMLSLMEKSKSISPDWFITDCHYINEIYQHPFQQDAHEFLLSLLDRFDQECKLSLSHNQFNAIENRPETLISNMFYGEITTIIKCSKCKYSNDDISEFADISIPIRQYKNVETAINKMYSHTSQKAIGKCEKCQKNNCLTTSQYISKFPPILIITLMRFDNQCKKIDDFLEYPKFIKISKNKIKYQLYAMIIHEGRMMSHGHFMSYIMNAQEIWYNVNDVCIFKVTEERILKQKPYVLFYKRCGI